MSKIDANWKASILHFGSNNYFLWWWRCECSAELWACAQSDVVDFVSVNVCTIRRLSNVWTVTSLKAWPHTYTSQFATNSLWESSLGSFGTDFI